MFKKQKLLYFKQIKIVQNRICKYFRITVGEGHKTMAVIQRVDMSILKKEYANSYAGVRNDLSVISIEILWNYYHK